jgi:rhodanese-related sulfurtransferase
MKNIARLLAAVAVAASITLGATACATSADSIEVTSDTVVIDVRTPAEFAEGHLDGALNIDVQGADFDALVSELPTDGDYVVYCRSGNRSAAAIARMEGLGFESLTNAGGLEDASTATGIDIVT